MFSVILWALLAISPNDAILKLQEGNKRFALGQSTVCLESQKDRRTALIDEQNPYAIILGCSDSRTAPEVLFDQGLGDLFIIRVAGNVLGESEIDSIRYAVKALKCPLIVVLGHENCGAVKAVWQKKAQDIPYVNKQILPAIDFNNPKCNLACQVKNNVLHIVKLLASNAEFEPLIKQGLLDVKGAFYPFKTGQVEFFDSVKQ